MLARLSKYDNDPYAKASIAGLVFFIVFYAGYLPGTHPPRNYLGYLIGRDFVNDWMGGRAVLLGHLHELFAFPTYQHYLHSVFAGLPEHNWSYPPDILLFIWPFALLPYLWGYVAWVAAGLAALTYTAWRCGVDKAGFVFLITCPAIVVNMMTGQNGFFTAALLIGALSLLDRRPLVAGVLIGLLTLKPQLGILIPLALALSGRWRVFAAATVTALALFAVTTALFGFWIWRDYVELALPYQRHVLDYGAKLMPIMMPTPYANVRVMALPHQLAFLVQIPFTLAAVAAVIWTFRTRRDPTLSMAVLMTAGLIVTPYMFNYDMVIFGWLLWRLKPYFASERETRLLILMWSLPATCMVIGWFGVPGSALIPVLLLFRLVSKLHALERTESPAQALPAPV